MVQTWFEFVGQVAGTATKFFDEMGSSHEGTWSPVLVAGTYPFMCADLNACITTIRAIFQFLSWTHFVQVYACYLLGSY